jgi:hypothetical protein
MTTILGDDTIEDLDDDEDPQKVAAQLIQLLNDDFRRVMKRLMRVNMEALANQNDTTNKKEHEFVTEWQSAARDVVRSFFAYVEGTVYSLKQYAKVQLALYERPLERHEADAVIECTYTMNERGVLKIKPMHIRFEANLLFMINLQERLHQLPPQLNKNDNWWVALEELVGVRDRLMHPKHPNDLNVEGEDIKTLILVRKGFNDLLEKFLGPRPWTLPDVDEYRPGVIPKSWLEAEDEALSRFETSNADDDKFQPVPTTVMIF